MEKGRKEENKTKRRKWESTAGQGLARSNTAGERKGKGETEQKPRPIQLGRRFDPRRKGWAVSSKLETG
jgi:hypothetical protein